MRKITILVMAIFFIPVLSVVGKFVYDSITENYTFASTIGANLTTWPWLVPYTRSMWWLIPAGAVVWIIIWFMRREEPKPPSYPSFASIQPRQSKVIPKKKQAPPPIFIGRK